MTHFHVHSQATTEYATKKLHPFQRILHITSVSITVGHWTFAIQIICMSDHNSKYLWPSYQKKRDGNVTCLVANHNYHLRHYILTTQIAVAMNVQGLH